jgi:hypothetical protein
MLWPRLALAASLPALLAVPAAAEEPESDESDVSLIWVEGVKVPEAVQGAMVREAAEILGPVGVRLRWRKGSTDTPSEAGELRVVPLGPAGRSAKTGRVLGATSTAEGPRTIWIDYENVAWVAGTSTDRLVSAGFAERRRVGVAMGRVIAHEVVHALVPQLPHAAAGLMGVNLRGALDRSVSLDPATRDAVRAAVATARKPEGETTASAR